MGDFQRIHEDVRKFATMFRGLLLACEQLGEIASVEQAIVEAQGRLHQAKTEEAGFAEVRAQERRAHEIAKEAEHRRGVALYAEKADQAERLIADANAKAALIVGAGHAKAAEITDNANKEANELRALVERHTAQLASVEALIAEEQKKLDDLTAAREQAQADHDRIRGLISELKAKL